MGGNLVKRWSTDTPNMKKTGSGKVAAFTLIELLVVVVIIGIMMTLASTVLRDPGTGRTLDSGLDLVNSMIEEARATAQGNDTYTRVVIVDDPKDISKDSLHLRYMVVQMLQRDQKKGGTYDATDVTMNGRWVSTSAGALLPPGVYFSPTHSRSLKWASSKSIGSGTVVIGKNKRARVYSFEFDEKGRFVPPGTSPTSPSSPQRIVLINARRGTGKGAQDGLVPLQQDKEHRPVGAKGLVLWPSGYTTPLRTHSQIYAK